MKCFPWDSQVSKKVKNGPLLSKSVQKCCKSKKIGSVLHHSDKRLSSKIIHEVKEVEKSVKKCEKRPKLERPFSRKNFFTSFSKKRPKKQDECVTCNVNLLFSLVFCPIFSVSFPNFLLLKVSPQKSQSLYM